MKKVYLLSLLSIFTLNLFCQTLWTKYPANPVLSPGSAGEWDQVFGLNLGSVIYLNGTYYMWYTGGINENSMRIGMATSPDGITWTKYANNPVMEEGSAGSWDESSVYDGEVVVIDDTFHMWYCGLGGSIYNFEYQIGHATSLDGITWTKDPDNPVLSRGELGTWDGWGVFSPFVLYDGAKYHMWYGAWDGVDTVDWPQGCLRIGHATSPDGQTWTKDTLNPVLIPVESGWDYPRTEHPTVIFDGTTYHMWYSGCFGYMKKIGYAKSTDGSKWTKSPFNPVLTIGPEWSWDWAQVSVFSVIDSSGVKFKMWYQGLDAGVVTKIGYAEAINDDSLPHQPHISGIDITCTGTTETYSVINEPGVTYSWIVTGGTVSMIDTANSVDIIWNSTGNQSIVVIPSNKYGNGRSGLRSVLVNPAASQPSKITGMTTVCTSETARNYKVESAPGMTYSWKVTGGKFSGDSSTNSVFIVWDSAGYQTITVTPGNSFCGAGPERQIEVNVNSSIPLVPDTITGDLIPHINDTCNYAIQQVSGATSYNWVVPAGKIINKNDNTLSVVWELSGDQTISVSVKNSCGEGDPYILNVNVLTDVFTIQSNNKVSVYPNPSDGFINIEVNKTAEQEIEIELLTVSGQVIYRNEYQTNKITFVQQIDLSGYAKGMYFLRIRQAGAVYNGKIIVQ